MATTALGTRRGAPADVVAADTRPTLTLRSALLHVLVVYALTRILLFVDALVIAHVNHLSLQSVLVTWDGNYYLSIAALGYPHSVATSGSTLAFFPLFPLLAHGLAILTRLPIVWALFAVLLVAGAAMGVLATLAVADRFGVRRGRQAGLLMVLFPGGFVLGLAYADGLAVAFSLAAFVALGRRRWLLAGLAGAAATASLPLVAAPLVVAALWAAISARNWRALVAPLLTPLGLIGYFTFLWVQIGSFLTWEHVQRLDWNVHVALPWVAPTGFTSYGMRTPEASTVTLVCAGLVVLGTIALAVLRAPGWWTAFALIVVASVTLDATTWLEPRFVFDAFPLVLGLGAVTPRRLFPAVAAVSFALLILQFATATPPNWTFFSP